MHCELLVPSLFSAGAQGRYPALELVLARGRRTPQGPRPQIFERWLHEAFSIDAKSIPAGALSAIAAHRDPRSEYWLRADPVHLRLMRDHALVVPAEALAISREEADALCASLNEHFAGVMEVVALDPRRWIARFFARELELDDVPALEVAGREIPLAHARDVALTEIQMLLHAHRANAAREARGESAINSLWLWGAGRLPTAVSRWASVAADEPLAAGLAIATRTRQRRLPAGAAAWLDSAPDEGRHLVVLDSLRSAALLREADRYHQELATLERDWFEPLLAALRAGRIGMLTVHVPDGEEARSFETVRSDLRRFWRMAKSIERYA